jgi:hypothetical protein
MQSLRTQRQNTSTLQLSETVKTFPITSSATKAPTDIPALISYPIFPPISTGELSTITVDGHIETTGSDHRPTRVPVLNPHCFFCPPTLRFVVALFDSLHGVYLPGPPPLPGAKASSPTITIGNNGDPTYSSPKKGRGSTDPKKDKVANASVNVDHAYEVKFLKEFSSP